MAIRVPVAQPRTRPSSQGLGYFEASPVDVRGLASGLAGAAGEFQERANREEYEREKKQAELDRETERTTLIADKAEAAIQRFEALRKLTDFQTGIQSEITEFKKGMDPTDTTFLSRVGDHFRERENKFLGSLPIELQDEFSFRTNQMRQSIVPDVENYVQKVRGEYFVQGIDQQAEILKSEFSQQPDDALLEGFQDKLDELIEAADISEPAKALIKKQWRHDLEAISLKRNVRNGTTTVLDAAGKPAEAATALTSAAQELGVDPVELAAVISYETGGTFSTSVAGGKGGNYLGLIQFGPEERKKYGVKEGQSFSEQMKSVVAYLKDRGFKPGMSLEDLYSTINAGTPGRLAASDGNNTVAGHVAEIRKSHLKNAQAFIKGQLQPDGIMTDPMYDNLTYSEKVALINDGQKEANELFAAQEKARKAERAAFENQLFIGLEYGTKGLADIQEAYETGAGLQDYDQLKKANDIYERRNEDAINARNFQMALEGKSFFDPTDTDMMKNYNAWVGKQGLEQINAMNQDYVLNTLQPSIEKTKVIPTDVVGALTGMSRSNDPKAQAFALNTLANFEDISPQAYDKVPANVQSDVNLWRRWKDVLPQDELFMEINGGYNAEQRAVKKAYRDEAEKVYTDPKSDAFMDTGMLLKEFDPGIFASTPQLPNIWFAAKGLQSDYQETFLHEYVRNNGNVEAAKTSTLQQMKSRWSVSQFGGTGTLMKNAPEKRYPSVAGTHDWLEAQARSEPQIADQIKPTDRLQLVSDGQTQREIDAGQSPSYVMIRTDEYGVPHEVTFGPDRQVWRQAFQLPPELAYVNELDFQVKELEQKLYTFHFGDDKVDPAARRQERQTMQLRLQELKDEQSKYVTEQTPAMVVGRGVRAIP